MTQQTAEQRGESPEEKLERVRMMAAGDPTWDLSGNDQAALRFLLDQLAAREAAIAFIEQSASTAYFNLKKWYRKTSTSHKKYFVVDVGGPADASKRRSGDED